jgi:beta-glucosidase
VQLYLHDRVSTVTRPVAELKGFRRLTIAPGGRETVTFTLGPGEIGALDRAMKWVVEPGQFDVRVGPSSAEGPTATFEVRP